MAGSDVLHQDLLYDEYMDSESKQVDISISGKVSYTDIITIAQAAQIIAYLNSDAVSMIEPVRGSVLPGSISSSVQTTVSNPRQALDRSGAKTNPERIVAFALYAMQQSGKEAFTLDEVKPLFRQARERTPGNMSRDLDVAIKAGWVAESDTKGDFYVTGRAHGVLDSGFEAIRSGKTGSGKSRSNAKRPRRASAEVPQPFIGVEISSTIDGYPDYHKIKTKTDRFLWAVNAAKLLGVEALTNQEMVWLTDRLGDGIATNDIAGNYRQNFKRGFVNRSTRDSKIRITPRGIEYLRKLTADGNGEA
jgi:hypothetical protein